MNLLMLSAVSELLLDNDPILVERGKKNKGMVIRTIGVLLLAVAGVALMLLVLLAGLDFIDAL